jgi:hypothetical protein
MKETTWKTSVLMGGLHYSGSQGTRYGRIWIWLRIGTDGENPENTVRNISVSVKRPGNFLNR